MPSGPLPRSISYSVIGWCVVGLLITVCGLGPSSSVASSGQVIIRSTGATPNQQTVSAGGSVIFYVVDGSRHEMYSGPHPEHTGCPALNIGAIGPPSDKRSGTLRAGVCQFHDDVSPDDARFQGTIHVQ